MWNKIKDIYWWLRDLDGGQRAQLSQILITIGFVIPWIFGHRYHFGLPQTGWIQLDDYIMWIIIVEGILGICAGIFYLLKKEYETELFLNIIKWTVTFVPMLYALLITIADFVANFVSVFTVSAIFWLPIGLLCIWFAAIFGRR